MRWRVTGASARGSAHLRLGIPNQDACEFRNGDRSSALRAVLAVSDGHGGARHFRSQVGSSLAVHTAIGIVYDRLETWLAETGAGIQDSPIEDAVPALVENVTSAWRAAVLSDFQHNPFSQEELSGVEAAEGPLAKASVEADPALAYGATLLAAAIADEFILYLQLGDGDILSVDESGETARPIAPDDRLIANQTTSLCLPDAPRQFRFAIARQFPALVLLATDGYANSFRSDTDFLKIGSDYLAILQKQGIDQLAAELPAILAGASQEGSGDDITLGVLHRTTSGTARFQVPVSAADAEQPLGTAQTQSPVSPSNTPPAGRGRRGPTKGQEQNSPGAVTTASGSRRLPGYARRGWIVGACALGLTITLFAYLYLFRHCCASPPVESAPTLQKAAKTAAAVPKQAAPAKSAPVLPKGKAFALDLSAGGGPVIELQPDDQILYNALNAEAEPSSEPYAEVRRNSKGGWDLVNLGPDPWTVQRAGKKFVEPPVNTGESASLEPKLRITFRNGTAATVQIVTTTRQGVAH